MGHISLAFNAREMHRTVQSEIERVLRQFKWTGKSILCAGRTDTGVHASGQVITFELDWKHGIDTLLRAA